MANTIISSGITIEGELSSEDDILVQGTVKGKLTAKDGVIVDPGGVVDADIHGGAMSIAGTVTGDLHSSDRVDLQNGARVVGNVKATRITIADGAQFKGSVDMDV
jgi:cytoskeletal protein CcmA (bactofilin family)